jgi:hypothetical protein
MVAFSRILDELEARAFERSYRRDIASSVAAVYAASASHIAQPGQADAAAFRAHEPFVEEKPAPDRTALLQSIRRARRDGARLRRLRREIAWDLHPDRAGAGGAALLADLNAEIDAALRLLAAS